LDNKLKTCQSQSTGFVKDSPEFIQTAPPNS